MTDADVYTLFCAIKEKWPPFSIEINKNKLVDELKKAIIIKNPDLQISARDLKLYRVDIPISDDTENDLNHAELSHLLGYADDIVEIFPSPPEKKKIHVLVELPAALPGLSISFLEAIAITDTTHRHTESQFLRPGWHVSGSTKLL